jgi:hypothetical protein
MSSLTILGDTSGSVVLQAPAVAGSSTINLPAASGTAMVSGNMPAFSAYLSSNQTISTGTDTKIQFNIETFDTANCYDNTTNYRYTPNVAGYYQVTVSVRDNTGAATGTIRAQIFKNGSAYTISIVNNSANGCTSATTNLIYMNGTTDYLEGYMFQNSGSSMLCHGLQVYTYFQAAMVRSA